MAQARNGRGDRGGCVGVRDWITQYIPVESRQGLRRAEFGWPLSWLAQDLTIYDPPFPSRVGSTAPQEALTKVNWAAFGTDILILSLFELLVLALVLRLGRARR